MINRRGHKVVCWNAGDFYLDLSAGYIVCSLCDTPLSCILIMCAFFCMYVILPPKRRNFGILIINFIHYKKFSDTMWKIYGMLQILILLTLTFVSVISKNINTSVLKQFATETNVFDEKTKTIFPLASICWIGESKYKPFKVLPNLLTCLAYSKFRILWNYIL